MPKKRQFKNFVNINSNLDKQFKLTFAGDGKYQIIEDIIKQTVDITIKIYETGKPTDKTALNKSIVIAKNKVKTIPKCDLCGCDIKTGNYYPVYNENYVRQKGLISCGKCFGKS